MELKTDNLSIEEEGDLIRGEEQKMLFAGVMSRRRGAVPINTAERRRHRGINQAAQRLARKAGRPKRALLRRGEIALMIEAGRRPQ